MYPAAKVPLVSHKLVVANAMAFLKVESLEEIGEVAQYLSGCAAREGLWRVFRIPWTVGSDPCA